MTIGIIKSACYIETFHINTRSRSPDQMSYFCLTFLCIALLPISSFPGPSNSFLQPFQHLQPKQCYLWSCYKLRNGANVCREWKLLRLLRVAVLDRFFAFEALFNVHLLPFRHFWDSSRERVVNTTQI